MGWCSGTGPHDKALDLFLKYVPKREHEQVMREWCEYMQDLDWDCESESEYYEYMLRLGIFEDD